MSTAAASARPARRSTVLPCVTAALSGALLMIALGFALGATAEERWLFATRYTARFSFPIFLGAFTASSWARLFPGDLTRSLLRARRGIGLGFAAAHTVHLAALTAYNATAGRVPTVVTLAGGGLAYAAMFAMAATSNDASVRALGRNWTRLHTFGAYWLWVIFAQSYATRVARGMWFFVPELTLAVAALALRFAARRRSDRSLPRE
jgi:DMSO/TMAO reductase YedYZ heme-binding membrane subunit